jgi:hypothetical protein
MTAVIVKDDAMKPRYACLAPAVEVEGKTPIE